MNECFMGVLLSDGVFKLNGKAGSQHVVALRGSYSQPCEHERMDVAFATTLSYECPNLDFTIWNFRRS